MPEHDTTPTSVAFWKSVSMAGGPAPVRASTQHTTNDEICHSFTTLLAELALIVRNTNLITNTNAVFTKNQQHEPDTGPRTLPRRARPETAVVSNDPPSKTPNRPPQARSNAQPAGNFGLAASTW